MTEVTPQPLKTQGFHHFFISCFSSKGAASKTVYCIRFLFRLGKQSVDELTGKLRRGSLRYIEAVELADVMGYNLVWQKRREER